MFDREIDVWVVGTGNKDLDLVGWVGGCLLDSDKGARDGGHGGELGGLEGKGGPNKGHEGNPERRHYIRISALECFGLNFVLRVGMRFLCLRDEVKLWTTRHNMLKRDGSSRDLSGLVVARARGWMTGVEGQQRQRSSMAGVR